MSRVQLSPKLASVTVYNDCAQLTFTAAVPITPSTTLTVAVENVEQWGNFDFDTLQVRLAESTPPEVAAAVLLQNINNSTETVVEDVREEVRQQDDLIKRLKAELEELADESTALEAVCAYVAKITTAVTAPASPVESAPPSDMASMQGYVADPTKWAAMAAFLSKRSAAAKREVVALTAKKRKVQEKLDEAVARQREIAGGVRFRSVTDLTATLVVGDELASATEVVVEVSCVVAGAGWSPLYDLRVDHASSMIDVLYYANVRQCTALDWERVRLRLSTATPQTGGSPPPLWPRWNISLRPPQVGFGGGVRGGPRGHMKKMALSRRAMPAAALGSAASCLVDAAPIAPMLETASIGEGGSAASATLYAIPGLVTVRHNNADVKVSVAHERLPARLRFVAMPKVSPLVQLSATATNSTDYEFVSGPSKIFYGNTFVNDSQLCHVSPGEEFEVSLGADETVTVTRTLVRRAQSAKAALFGPSKSHLKFHYSYSVECGVLASDKPVTVLVKDNYPISDDADVVVQLAEPLPTPAGNGADNAKAVTVDEETHEVVWSLPMATRAKEKLTLVFTADYPEGTNVFGLE